MYNLIKTPGRSSRLDVEHQPMQSVASLSIKGDSLSVSLVIEPARKQSLRLSFVESYPTQLSTNAHRRFESEESIESQQGYTLYSQESLASSSNMSHVQFQGETLGGLSTRPDYRINSHISLSNCYTNSREIQPTSLSMRAQESTESQIDPYLGQQVMTLPRPQYVAPSRSKPTIPSGLEPMEISDSDRFSPISDSDLSSNQINFSKHSVPKPQITSLGLVRNSVASAIGAPTSAGILDLFPAPPPARAQGGHIDQDDEDDCFADWLQQVQERFISRQASLTKNQAKLEFKHMILRSYNTEVLNKEMSSININPAPFTMPSYDFDTYHGLANDMRSSHFLQPQFMRPASFCKISTVGEESIDFCQQPEFSAEEELQEREQLMKATKLEAAQMCSVRDEQGRKTLFKDVIRHRQTFVIFLRFFWCAKCQDYVRSISKFFEPGSEARKQLDDSNSTVVFIGTGSWRMISSYRTMLGCSFNFYSDTTTTSRLFRKMGLNRILLGGSSDPATLHKTLSIWQTMIETAKSIPKLPLHYPGSFTQLGGEFCFQNLSADYTAPTTPATTPKYSLNRNRSLIKNFSLKTPKSSVDNSGAAPRMEVLHSDPFRRSFIDQQPGTTSLSAVKCIYANRMKSSSSHGNFYDLFKSAGVQYAEPLASGTVAYHQTESSYIME